MTQRQYHSRTSKFFLDDGPDSVAVIDKVFAIGIALEKSREMFEGKVDPKFTRLQDAFASIFSYVLERGASSELMIDSSTTCLSHGATGHEKSISNRLTTRTP